MKYLTQKIRMVILLSLLVCTPLHARNFVVGISPNIPSSHTKQVFKKVVKLLLEDVHRGDEAILYDAYSNKLLGTFKVPDKRGYDHPKPKAKYNKAVLMKLKMFLNTEAVENSESGNIASLIRLPQFLNFIGENVKSGGVTDVLLIGSPLYVDFKETTFSMTDGFFPSDSHINASVQKSIYGTKERKSLLKGIRLHFAYRDVSWHNDLHQKMIKRFWSLYLSEQGGSMVTFISDLDTVIARAIDNDSTNRRKYGFNKKSTKLEMLSVKRAVIRRRVEKVFEKPLSSLPAIAPTSYTGKVLVGIKWDCLKCDLDLYARSKNGAKILFYGNTSSPEGTYHKDFLDSPTPVNGLEFIQFKNNVDVRGMFLAVNFYNGGSSSGPRGEIRVELDGVVYAKRFHIRAIRGNQGKDIQTLNNSSHWVVINPMDIVLGR